VENYFGLMSDLSFEIRCAKDLFGKLVREYDRFRSDPYSADHAINFSTTAHHLFKDWLQRELVVSNHAYSELKSKIHTGLFKETEVIRDICDGSKHVLLERPPARQVTSSGSRMGDFSRHDFSNEDFDIGGLFITLHDGSKLYFMSVADKVIQFWTAYFETYV